MENTIQQTLLNQTWDQDIMPIEYKNSQTETTNLQTYCDSVNCNFKKTNNIQFRFVGGPLIL